MKYMIYILGKKKLQKKMKPVINKERNKQTWLMMLAQQWQVRGGNRPLSAFQHTVEKHTERVFENYILIAMTVKGSFTLPD